MSASPISLLIPGGFVPRFADGLFEVLDAGAEQEYALDRTLDGAAIA